ncbi:endonuclease domain-containing protein [Sphingobium amiense]|uniref:Endonuclease domain-containing protein n=1 Tax=Sphingobium amiense TaxID=135719 RepID=A0A494WGF9_9SPHN|nr:endonuclease domain-containing protein [Sphingobium amiense]
MTLPEVLLWQQLRERPAGLRFRRQHPAGHYILDFFCPRHRLAVEVDGEVHGGGDAPARDAMRDAWLAGEGIRVLRISATDILRDLDAAVLHIIATASRGLPLRQPSGLPPPLSGED